MRISHPCAAQAHVELPECKEALRTGRLVPDGEILADGGTSVVTKAAIEPVWYLPGVAERFGVSERVLRDALFAETNSMYPELISRDDLKVFLPPIGGMTVYIWGDVSKIPDESVELTCRVHDRVGKGGFNVTSTCDFSDEMCQVKGPLFENPTRDDLSSKNESKRVKTDRDTSLKR